MSLEPLMDADERGFCRALTRAACVWESVGLQGGAVPPLFNICVHLRPSAVEFLNP